MRRVPPSPSPTHGDTSPRDLDGKRPADSHQSAVRTWKGLLRSVVMETSRGETLPSMSHRQQRVAPPTEAGLQVIHQRNRNHQRNHQTNLQRNLHHRGLHGPLMVQ